MRSALEEALGGTLQIEMLVMSWLIRHAGWLLTRYNVRASGRTPYKAVKGREYGGDIAEFGEQVYLKEPGLTHAKMDDRWSELGTWLGKTDKGDEHIIALSKGVVKTSRSIRRSTPKERWNKTVVFEIQATPWEPIIKHANLRDYAPRRRYITLNELVQHGASPNCRSCAGDGGAHSESCRARFEKIWANMERKAEAKTVRQLDGATAATPKAAASSDDAPAPAPEAVPMQDTPT